MDMEQSIKGSHDVFTFEMLHVTQRQGISWPFGGQTMCADCGSAQNNMC